MSGCNKRLTYDAFTGHAYFDTDGCGSDIGCSWGSENYCPPSAPSLPPTPPEPPAGPIVCAALRSECGSPEENGKGNGGMEENGKGNGGMIAGIVAGVVCLVAVAIGVYCLAKRRAARRTTKETAAC